MPTHVSYSVNIEHAWICSSAGIIFPSTRFSVQAVKAVVRHRKTL